MLHSDTIDEKYGQRLRELRKALHMRPELSQQEVETTALIKSTLAELKIELIELDCPTGTVGIIRGARPGRTIGIRADIDALPIEEATDNPVRSVFPGKMHACGHDMHATFLLGAGMALKDMQERLCGNVVLIFQPAEEDIFGANAMIAAGLLEKIHFDAIIGGHVKPYMELGQVNVSAGAVMAAKDSFSIDVIGKGGHGAAPQTSHDPIVAAATIISALQSVSSRERDPALPGVLSICAINGGSADNIIPDRVRMLGSMRTFSGELCKLYKRRIKEISEGIAGSMGCAAAVDFYGGVPVLENDSIVAGVVKDSAIRLLGVENIVTIPCEMISEDFAVFAQRIPSCYCFIGTHQPGTPFFPLHNSGYYAPDAVIPIGAALYANAAMQLCKSTLA